jgi:hypothetical protein
MFLSYPIWLIDIVQTTNVPTAIEVQGWLIAVVAAAMGLVKIAMWLRGAKENGKNGDYAFKNMEIVIQKLVENDERLSASQQRLADNQLKALENHSKITEAITLLRAQLQNMENSILAGQERRATDAVNDVKDMLRGFRDGK